MAKVFNHITKEYRKSVNTPDYSSLPDWIVNPDFSAVGGSYNPDPNVNRYWKQDDVDPNAVVEMTQPEKDIVDASQITNDRATKLRSLENAYYGYVYDKYPMDMVVMTNSLYEEMANDQKTIVDEWAEWLLTVGEYYATISLSISTAANLAALDLITWDFSTFNGTDPGYRLDNTLNT